MKVTIAALLHDIGKFYQRAEIKLGNEPLYQQYVKNNGSYVHGGFTARFFIENIKSSLSDYHNVLSLSAGHHKDVDSIIKKADFIASGHDRKDADSGVFANEDLLENDNYISKRLNLIFNEIKFEGVNTPYELELTELSNLKIKKQNRILSINDANEEYKKLYSKMQKELNEMNEYDYNSYSELHHLIYPIIKEFTTTVPGSTYNQNIPTVSLFDHLKLTTAIANCLEINDNGYFVMVDYDISGIQKFIYKISEGRESKPNVAKMLRARSFYLSILTDFVAYYIVQKFNLSYENILYSSGGRGRILVPNIDNVDLVLKEISALIESAMFELHNSQVAFNIGYTVVSESELKYSTISDLIYDGFNIISDKKHKFKSIISSEKFTPIKDFGDNLCPLCLEQHKGYGLCHLCEILLKINQDYLVNNQAFFVEFNFNNFENNNDFNIKIANLGNITLHKTISKVNIDSFYLSINNHKIGETKMYARSNIGSKSFEEIAKNCEGDIKLAAVKMDVDNLGYIFLNGIEKSKETISKNLTLSRMMDYFFTNKLVEICNKEFYKESVYINYAGGDDLVVILPASMALDFIKDINKEFTAFTGNNQALHISAGIEIFNSSSPIRYVIDKAEEFLEKSKSIENKKAFTILDVTLKNEMLEELLMDISNYKTALDNENLSRSGLYEIYNYLLMSLENENEIKHFMRFIPLIAYSIKRNMSEEWFEKLKNIFVVQDINLDTLRYYKVVFGMALLESRKRG